ncbi:hypothetical protein BDV23DRAFT_171951 [Aspergillus alliaceus]|uniref:Uncharacterized protein n=1 Tax=Petromyces alliaceus TaxID=209559 RepID=A0A5N7CB94_PETAA|nr:hypothetical protein BDV23DRAFT_171951 [Aspergillus alliaceus]
MHFTNLLPLLTLLATPPTTTALSAARVWANFSPQCPADDHTSYPDDPNLKLHEEFTTAVDVVANKCQEVPVPLRYTLEVDHISIDAELFWQDSLDQCNITVHELPGCSEPPLIRKALGQGKTISECEERNFTTFTQVWVKLECEKIRPVYHEMASWLHGKVGSYTAGNYTGAVGANNTGNNNGTGNGEGDIPYIGNTVYWPTRWL